MEESAEQQTLPWLRTPEMPIQLQVTGSGARAFCELLGVVEGVYLVVRSGRRDPDALDGLNLQVGDVLVARYVMHGTVAGFRSPVSLILRSPERLAFLDYPKRIERFALRAEERLECLLPCRVELEGQAVSGLMLDVSASGGLFSLRADGLTLSGEDPVTIVVRLPEHEHDIRLTGRVQRVLGEGAVHRIGVVFDEAAQPFCETMRQYAALAAD